MIYPRMTWVIKHFQTGMHLPNPSNTGLGYTHGQHGFEALGIGVSLWHSHRHDFWE